MTQEQKDLLVKDLCARLPYAVKVNITSRESKNRIVYLTVDNICHLKSGWWSECKPYLFPLSSMAKEELREYNYLYAERENNNESDDIEQYSDLIDWFNKNHFDYRGLIGESLALDATGLNIY